MQGTVFIFPICAVAVASNCFFSELAKEDDGILNRQKYLSESVFPRLTKALDIFIRKGQTRLNLFGKCVEYYNFVLNKTCYDNRML